MSITSVNGYNSFIVRQAKDAAENAESALQQQASGLKSTDPGKYVSERAQANALDREVSSLKNVSSILDNVSDLLRSVDSVVHSSYSVTGRMSDLVQMANNPMTSDRDLASIDEEIKSLFRQMQSNSETRFNGMVLMDGSYSGEQKLSTLQSEKLLAYDITDVSQYSSYRKVADNPLLKLGSTVEAVDVMGRSEGQRKIDLSGIHAAGNRGSEIVIDGETFTAVDLAASGIVETSLSAHEFALGTDDLTTIRNLIKKLNTSELSAVNHASYRLQSGSTTEMNVAYNQAGSIGEKFLVEVRIKGGSNNHMFDLKDATDMRERAVLEVKFDNAGNYTAGDKISLGGQEFEFVATAADVVKSNHIALGANLAGTFSNLFDTIRNSDGPAAQATYDYNSTTSMLTVTTRKAGVAGNEFTVNFAAGGSGGIAYSLYSIPVADTPTTKENVTASIASIKSGGVLPDDKVSFEGTKVSTHEATFDSRMAGSIHSLSATFIAGNGKEGVTTANDQFDPNQVQFTAVLNGEVYHTGRISLSGGNKKENVVNGVGYKGLGNRLGGGTELVFQKVGARNTDAGFKLTVGKGLTLHNDDSIESAQAELTRYVTDGGSSALETGNVALGISAPSRLMDDFSLKNIDQFSTDGFVSDDSSISAVKVTDRVGNAQARGTLKLVGNLAKNDLLYINGSRFTIGVDLVDDPTKTTVKVRDEIVKFLNNSKDANVSKAVYSAGTDDGTVIVTHKASGSDGNKFLLGFNTATAGVVEINGHLVNSAQVQVSRYLGDDDNKPNVVEGSNLNIPTVQYSPTLQGNISNFNAKFIEGSAPAKQGLVLTPNAVEFSAQVGGETYTGKVMLSGGMVTSGTRPTPNGSNYNKLGGFISGGTEISMHSTDKTHAVVLTVFPEGFSVEGSSKSDIERKLTDITDRIESDIAKISIAQSREVTAFDQSKLSDTLLSGLRRENVQIRGSGFDAKGNLGVMGKFQFDSATDTLSVTIGSVAYRQQLSNSEADGGLGNRYDSENKVVKGGLETTIALTSVAPSSSTPQKLLINLQGVHDVDLGSKGKAEKFADLLNSAFGVSGSAGGLTFQAGSSADDVISFTIQDISPDALFVDKDGKRVEIDVFNRDRMKDMIKVLSSVEAKLNVVSSQVGSAAAQVHNQNSMVINNLYPSLEHSRDNLRNTDMFSAAASFVRYALGATGGGYAFSHSIALQRQLHNVMMQG